MSESIKKAALAMAARGFKVFPCLPNGKPPFEWNEKEKKANCSKKDRKLAGGIRIATTDPEQIAAWFNHKLDKSFGYGSLDINFGVPATGLCILDYDVKNDAWAAVEELIALGELPKTFTTRTPSNGNHYYFGPADVGQRKLSPNIDVRSRNGYVVGPGSVINGREYEIIVDAEIAELPDRIHTRLGRVPQRDAEAVEGRAVVELDTESAIEAGIAWLAREEGVVDGNRGNIGFLLACQLKDLGLSANKIHELLADHWNVKNSPPIDDERLLSIAENAHKSGRHAAGSSNPEAEFGDLPGILAEIFPKEEQSGKPNFKPWIQGRNPDDIPERPWVIPGVLLEKSITALVSEPGVGKSTQTLALAIGIALGNLEFLGLEYRGEPRNVMLVNNEDDADEMDRRVAAICRHNQLDYDEVTKRLHWHNPDDETPFIAMLRCPKTRALKPSNRMRELRAYCRAAGISVVIFDPLADTHEGAENDNSEMARVMTLYRHVLRKEKMAGIVVHHTRKPGGDSQAGEAMAARGASAIIGNVRVAITLCRCTEEEGYKLGLSPTERLAYTRLDTGKGSYAAAGKNTKWYRTTSVQIGRGDDTAPAIKLVTVDALDEQRKRMIETLHSALVDSVSIHGELPIDDAAAVAAVALVDIEVDQAKRLVLTLFAVPRELQGTSLKIEGKGAKAKLIIGS